MHVQSIVNHADTTIDILLALNLDKGDVLSEFSLFVCLYMWYAVIDSKCRFPNLLNCPYNIGGLPKCGYWFSLSVGKVP